MHYRKRKLHPIELTIQEKRELKLYAANLGYEIGLKEVNGVVYPTIAKGDRMGFIQRYKEGLKAVYQQKKMDLDLAMLVNKKLDGTVKPGTTLYRFWAGIIDFEWREWDNDYICNDE